MTVSIENPINEKGCFSDLCVTYGSNALHSYVNSRFYPSHDVMGAQQHIFGHAMYKLMQINSGWKLKSDNDDKLKKKSHVSTCSLIINSTFELQSISLEWLATQD